MYKNKNKTLFFTGLYLKIQVHFEVLPECH